MTLLRALGWVFLGLLVVVLGNILYAFLSFKYAQKLEAKLLGKELSPDLQPQGD